MKQTSVAAADYSSTSARHGEATWAVAGSPDGIRSSGGHYKPLIADDDYECRPTAAGRTSMPGMEVPSGVDI